MAPLDISSLTVEERLGLIDELWNSLSSNPDALPLTAAHREELDRRLDEMDQDGSPGIPWEDAVARIRSRAR